MSKEIQGMKIILCILFGHKTNCGTYYEKSTKSAPYYCPRCRSRIWKHESKEV